MKRFCHSSTFYGEHLGMDDEDGNTKKLALKRESPPPDSPILQAGPANQQQNDLQQQQQLQPYSAPQHDNPPGYNPPVAATPPVANQQQYDLQQQQQLQPYLAPQPYNPPVRARPSLGQQQLRAVSQLNHPGANYPNGYGYNQRMMTYGGQVNMGMMSDHVHHGPGQNMVDPQFDVRMYYNRGQARHIPEALAQVGARYVVPMEWFFRVEEGVAENWMCNNYVSTPHPLNPNTSVPWGFTLEREGQNGCLTVTCFTSLTVDMMDVTCLVYRAGVHPHRYREAIAVVGSTAKLNGLYANHIMGWEGNIVRFGVRALVKVAGHN